MTQLEQELEKIKSDLTDQFVLVTSQFVKAQKALMDSDEDEAADILHYETRVNAYELNIDRQCENAIALQSPVASDLRFILSVLNINSDLERIGDHAEGIAKYVLTLEEPIAPSLLEVSRLEEMFDITKTMLEGVLTAFQIEDGKLARKTFKMDNKLNKINEKSSMTLTEYIKDHPDSIRQTLFIFSTIRKMERVGDLCKNIAEDIIFYIEAKILKHKGKRDNRVDPT
jgi:phosphate transport system protein